MTMPAAATTSGPIAPPAPRAAPQVAPDPFAFGAVLDSLPGASAKADASTTEEGQRPSNEARHEEPSRGQTGRHSLLNDGALLAALPFAFRTASTMNERPQAASDSPLLASPAMKEPKSEDSGASIAAGAKAATVGRLVGERAFHYGASTFADAIASRALAVNAPFAPGAGSAAGLTAPSALNGESGLAAGFSPAEGMPTKPQAEAVPPIASATAPTPIAPRAGAPPTHRASLTRAAAHEAARSGQKPDGTAPPPGDRAATSAAVHALAESSGKTADGRPPDPVASTAPAAARTDLFDAQLSAPFAAGAAFQLDGSTASAGHADVAPRASALATGPAPSTPPIREIDVDLSPGGLEDVSMTMRLAGDKLSVVIRAASSQTLGSIEGARDAIADRMAAIGQPLDSLIVKQTGVNTDGNANGNGSSADGGSAGGGQRSAQGSGERGSNDALSRRSAGRDRSF
ncbi:MAG TPA: flagellar hook-length control protein FliK [Roseiarcus sp.]|nr:flagellar hook-length control protein FliK [Roseiarcus sp.]